MTMHGSAFLPIWHDVDREMEFEFNRWHTVEHMPERLDTPGMLAGRRYADPKAGLHRYFTLYEAVSFDVFESEGYFATANARSEWTCRIHPHFRNFKRAPCHLVMTRGRGIGGALITLRLCFAPAATDGPGKSLDPKDRFNLAIRPMIDAIMQISLVTSAHAGVAAPVARSPLSAQSLSLRPGAMDFDAVLMVETIDRKAALGILDDIEGLIAKVPQVILEHQGAVYDLAYWIASRAGS